MSRSHRPDPEILAAIREAEQEENRLRAELGLAPVPPVSPRPPVSRPGRRSYAAAIVWLLGCVILAVGMMTSWATSGAAPAEHEPDPDRLWQPDPDLPPGTVVQLDGCTATITETGLELDGQCPAVALPRPDDGRSRVDADS